MAASTPSSSTTPAPAPTRPSLLLATCNLLPAGEAGGGLLLSELDAVGVDARWVSWDDPSVDWAAADLVAVRSTWDYHRRCPEFLAWARRTQEVTRLLNGAEVFAWNADKAYLIELASRVPVVPTRLVDDADLVTRLAEGIADFGAVVVKPRTGAGGIGVVLAATVDDQRLDNLVAAPWVLQPLVESVRTTGETSVHVFAGRAVSRVDRSVAGEEVRVHESYGGSSRAVPLGEETSALAEATVAAAAQLLGADLTYARVDLLRWQGGWVVSELELIEPGLYLDVDPANAQRFAALVAGVT
ncbi:MAG: hypothetical protein LH468_04995 [Nocardioides sp.]|nr:hypothetical protein [Nocardioides sp.]